MEYDELLRRAEDLCTRCERTCTVTATPYLTPAEQVILQNWSRGRTDCQILFHGGHPDCERKVAFFLPYYLDADQFQADEYFIALRAVAGFGTPSHRDYMGAILGLGIRRDFLGDIWVQENTATIFCLPSVADHIKLSLDKVGRYGVKITELSLAQVEAPIRKTKQVSFTVQSLRLDAITAGLFHVSRTIAVEQIRAGLVTLNYLPCLRPDAPIKEGDTLSLRGHGKGIVLEIGGQSRKGRLFIQGELYI